MDQPELSNCNLKGGVTSATIRTWLGSSAVEKLDPTNANSVHTLVFDDEGRLEQELIANIYEIKGMEPGSNIKKLSKVFS